MASNYDDADGVWRTIGGRRVFIKNGQSLSEAMIQSGKFKNLRSDYRKAKQQDEEIDNNKALTDEAKRLAKGEYKTKEEEEMFEKAKKETEELLNQSKSREQEIKAKQEAVNKSFEENQRQLQEAMKNETYPRAEGGTKFEDLGLEVSDKKAFSDYLRDKYGTDDFRVINFDNKEGAKKIYDEYASQRENDRITNYFNEQERNAYLNKDWSYGYRKETLENMSNKELDEYIKKNEELVNDYTNRYNQSSQYDQRYTRNRQDKLFDSASKTKYEKQLQDAQNEKARREAEVDKYFTKVDSKENSKDTFTQHLDMHGGTREYTKEDLNKMKEAGVKPMEHSYTGGGWEGVNSDKYMDTKDQAKAITDAMKKQYPDVKISRKSNLFSGGSSIDFNIMSSDKDLFVSDADIDKMGFADLQDVTRSNGFEWWAKDNVPHYKDRGGYTIDDVRKYAKESLKQRKTSDIQGVRGNEWYLNNYGKNVVSELNKQANSYTYDDSDGMVDYFDHGTYMHISIGKWDKPYEVTQKPTNELKEQIKRRIWAEKTLNEQYKNSDRKGKQELTNNFNKELRKQNELEKKYGKIPEEDFKKMRTDIYDKAEKYKQKQSISDNNNETMNNKLRNSAYKKYMKEHPNSKMTLDQFLKKK